jgi:hypothetical protein
MRLGKGESTLKRQTLSLRRGQGDERPGIAVEALASEIQGRVHSGVLWPKYRLLIACQHFIHKGKGEIHETLMVNDEEE